MKRIAFAGVFAALLLAAGALFFLTRPAASSCSYPAPVNGDLPSILKSIGGFDQAHNPSDVSDLQSNAVSAATAINANLIGVSALSPVIETPVQAGPDATIVPLSRNTQTGHVVVALVAYLSDCSGRLYYDKIDYLGSGPIAAFPVMSRQFAAAQLGGQTPQLQFYSDPFRPFWTVDGRQVAAS
jgi:hypothetical protein